MSLDIQLVTNVIKIKQYPMRLDFAKAISQSPFLVGYYRILTISEKMAKVMLVLLLKIHFSFLFGKLIL